MPIATPGETAIPRRIYTVYQVFVVSDTERLKRPFSWGLRASGGFCLGEARDGLNEGREKGDKSYSWVNLTVEIGSSKG